MMISSDKREGSHIIILLSIFVISLSLFAYQVTLTRLYSAILFYHYVFLVTSFAILGIGIGSVLAYKDNKRSINVMMRANKGAIILSGGFISVFILIYIQPFIDSLMIYIVLGIIPFIISGYIYGMLFRAWATLSGKLYFADLAGAAFGSIFIAILLNNAGMFRTAILICLMPMLAALILPSECRKLKIMGYVMPLVLLMCLFLPTRAVNTIETNFYALLNNSGKTYGEMQRSGLEPEIVFSRWDSFARTDLIRMEGISELKILTIDGSANAPMYAFDGNIESLYVFETNVGYIPFSMGTNERVLVVGAGGGRGVLYALAAGSTDIAAVEINPASIEAARVFGDFNGHIFDRPDVRVYIQDGRNFVRTSQERFDVIFLSLVVTNTAQGVGFALSENYIHTVEAMEDYLASLNENGRVAFITHEHGSLIRLTATAMQALMNRGIPLEQTPNHIALYHQIVGAQMISPSIIIKDQPFTEEESYALRSELRRAGLTPAHIPHFNEWPPLGAVGEGLFSFDQFLNTFEMNATPVTDNSPYFFHFERNIPPVLLQILAFSLVGSALVVAIFARKKSDLKPTIYFGLLGMGFMMVQIPFIQMFILYLGHPTLAFSYTLAAMLIGCGVGGFFSGRLFKNATKVYFPPVFAAIIILALLLSLNHIFQATSGIDTSFKIAIAVILAATPGIFMGMPFPRGLILLGESERNDIIPVMWGINGTLSVAGSVLSIILSMMFGFNIALLVGAGIYLLVGLFREM